jgi:hypothetical protein
LPFAGAVTCRPPADLGELEMGFARCFGLAWRDGPAFIYIDRIDGQNGLVSRCDLRGIAWRGSLPSGDNIKLQCSFQSPKDKSCCRTDNSKIQQQSPLSDIFELQPNLLRAYCFQIGPLRVGAFRQKSSFI